MRIFATPRTWILGVAAASLVVAACGGGGGDSSQSPTTSPPVANATRSRPAAMARARLSSSG